jgi:hypothetical protein
MNTGTVRNLDGFVRGLTSGVFGSFVGASAVLYVLSRSNLVTIRNDKLPAIDSWAHWAYSNLGSSTPVFALLLLAFFVTLGRLRRYLLEERPVNEIVQLDHLTDIWTTLFFGTGVIWTAIGMRSALLFALGDPENTMQQGAFAMLKRLVEGGILLALSTTIFGGIGGYVMRVYKSVSLGALLQRCYDHAARVDTSSMRDTLERIETHLKDRGGKDAAPTQQP